ncbi:helix-turn-helix domain-containing protein [Vibrio harveyi]|uniref:helix-turn-helix domain-containing protein n=1 Tax=Vibrio harveyi TaxID=669 RepID=UPI003CF7EF67
MKLDQAIRMGMGKKKMNAEQLADRALVHRVTVHRWINNKSKPDKIRQQDLAVIFGVSYAEFLRWGRLL